MTNKTFSILLPPPNITGSLHIGHYFNWTLQDFLIQYKKQQGYQINWHVGLDHAGIATQYIVERELNKQGKSRLELGRDKFYEEILKWNEHAKNLIKEQVNNFDFPEMHWGTHRFTMDRDFQKKVTKAFVQLYNDGLIHKKLKPTNWDTKFQSAISDLEVIEKQEKCKIYIIEYKSTSNQPSLFVATTRPETIFADSALCLNINDPRKQELKGQEFFIPIINKKIPVIFDELCQLDKGLGVLKVTPAHDFLDYEIGEKHNLEMISIINKEGTLFNTTKELDGLTVNEAREQILLLFQKNNIYYEEKEWDGIKKYTEKSNIPVETILTEQWFLDVKAMAQTALQESKNIEFYPEYLRTTFANWMTNIKPWCISRQIWWGHQIPIWYTKNNDIIAATTKEEAQNIAGNTEITQETDVLDTWFSSALWPQLSNETTDVLITGKDILFFWVARMIMFSLYFEKKIPFKVIYFNGIIRDASNNKMSKTKGNVINPLEINNKYGQDVLRFALLRKTGGNKDIKLLDQDLDLARNFITKINNAHIFITQFMSKEEYPHEDLNNWMETIIIGYQQTINAHIENFEFQKAAESFYDLFWNNFCSWYIEGIKKHPTQKALNYLKHIFKIGQPFLPKTLQKHNISIQDLQVLSKKPTKFDQTMQIVKLLRSIKKRTNLKEFYIDFEQDLIRHYTKLNLNPGLTFAIMHTNISIYIEKEHIILFTESLIQDQEKLVKEINMLQCKLNNTSNVPENIINEWQENYSTKNQQLTQIKNLLNTIN